jgi:ribonuclease P/MRP protein subunit POP1
MPPKNPSGEASAPGKRKEPPSGNSRDRKRIKTQDYRIIANQTADEAFNDGDLNVAKFVQAREYEIKALEEGIKSSKHGLSTRAFQEVPRDMRRRTASHNVKKIPKRLQARAKREV